MLKAIKIRLYPDSDQQIEINKLLGASRFAYNYCLDKKINAYKQDKSSLSTSDLNKEIIILKNTEGYSWLKDAHSKVIQQSLLNLDSAYKNFFKNKKGFPKFKSRHNKNSCRFPVDAIGGINGNQVNLIIKLKNLHYKCSVRDEKYLNKNQDHIKSASLSRSKSGKYFLSILINNFVPRQMNISDKTIGIDLGIKDFVVASDGTRFENLKIKRNNHEKLIFLNRDLSKKKNGSNNKNKSRIKLAKYHEKLNNKKENYLHHVANILLNENQVIAMENLNISGMMKNHNLARSIQELSLSEFKRILSYKSAWHNKELIQVDMFFPSSKLCNKCDNKNQDLKLSDRTWVCKTCGAIHDRDQNAAINIWKEGLRLKNKIGTSGPELTLVENGSVDDLTRNGPLKSTCSRKQEGKIVRFADVFENK